jgi:hypothetical protein
LHRFSFAPLVLPEAAEFPCGLVATGGQEGVRASLHIRLGFHWVSPRLYLPAPAPLVALPMAAFTFVLIFMTLLLSRRLKSSSFANR